jgi:hypothetical protein
LALGTAAALAVPAAGATADTALAQPFAAGSTHTVTLITGDQVTLATSANGTTDYRIRPVSGNRGFESFQAGNGDRYVIPAIAVPYLGQLDPSLFDVSALARSGSANIPVRLSFPAGDTPSAPPGVTLTSTTGSTATGYVTPASAPAFGAALRVRIGADVAARHRAGTTPLPAGVSLVGAPLTVRPNYPLHILQINGTDLNGQPADSDVVLLNVDSMTKEVNIVPVSGGFGRIAVPAGNYAAYGFFSDFDTAGMITASRLVAVDPFTVPDTGSAAVTLDERSASSRITVTPPKAAVQDVLTTTIARTDAAGTVLAIGLDDAGDIPTYVSPVAKPAIGSLRYVVGWGGAAPDPNDHYRVDLAFSADEIPADETFVGRPDQLAAVREVMYSDPASGTAPAGLLSSPVDPVIGSVGGLSVAVPAPGVTTDYLGTGFTRQWQQAGITPTEVLLQGDPQTYHSGQRATMEWGHGPVAAGLGRWTGPQFCDACSAGDTFSLAIPMFRDSVPDHTGFAFSAATVRFTLYRDDTVLFDQDGYYGAAVTVPRTPATFRGVLDVDQTGIDGVSQAVTTHTEETVRYDPDATSTPLPAADACAEDTTTAVCQVVGAITVDYQLPADLTNTSHSPVQVLGLRVGHVSYDGVGSHSPITSVTVSVSFDNGTTWQRVPVVGARGEYTALWRNRTAGTSPSLRVAARDAAGDAFSQTISDAYTIGGAR